MAIKKTNQERINSLKADMLLGLIREHKKGCHSPNCGISLSVFIEDFERLKGRKINEKEFKYFF